jgi:hypothetical protein
VAVVAAGGSSRAAVTTGAAAAGPVGGVISPSAMSVDNTVAVAPRLRLLPSGPGPGPGPAPEVALELADAGAGPGADVWWSDDSSEENRSFSVSAGLLTAESLDAEVTPETGPVAEPDVVVVIAAADDAAAAAVASGGRSMRLVVVRVRLEMGDLVVLTLATIGALTRLRAATGEA